MKNYQAVIGIEMHCELKSNAKIFSLGKNSFSQIPNSNVSEVDMAFPGTLPIINKKCVENGIKMALVLNCQIPKYLMFDRKNYFYPDLPKGYQITQNAYPIGTNGNLEIEHDNKTFNVSIQDIHLEEDTASLEHANESTYINYNRAGVPLLELVTDPCFHSADEVISFLEYIRLIYQYCDISEADPKKGHIRCDVNISLKEKNSDVLGTRVEIKNVNNFRNIKEAINYEIERQTKLLENNELVEQETRRFDEATGTTIRMRKKEDALDYKYFVEPNIPRYKISEDWIEKIKSEIPLLPLERKKKYEQYNLNNEEIYLIIKHKNISDYFEECLKLNIEAKTAVNWITTQIIGYLNKSEETIDKIYITPKRLATLIDFLNKNIISSKQAKEIFIKSLEEKQEIETYINKDNAQITDEAELRKIIENILNKNENQINEYHNGKTNLFQFFVGQVMKETKGKASPVLTKDILKNILDK